MSQPLFLIGTTPFANGRDPQAVTIHVHRMDGRPANDPSGQRLRTDSIALDALCSEFLRIVGQLGATPHPEATSAEPLSLPVVNGRIVKEAAP